MIEFLEAPDDVIALKVDGILDEAGLEAVLDRLEWAMGAFETVHVYVETHAIHGIELRALPRYTARALPLFGSLDRFGRVAVVADQAWVRFWTRLESALLPFIAYRTYTPEHRDEAFAWVAGREAKPVPRAA